MFSFAALAGVWIAQNWKLVLAGTAGLAVAIVIGWKQIQIVHLRHDLDSEKAELAETVAHYQVAKAANASLAGDLKRVTDDAATAKKNAAAELAKVKVRAGQTHVLLDHLLDGIRDAKPDENGVVAPVLSRALDGLRQ